jgi:tripartite-type tricarboxylate transporter receptor subunit TctC
MKRLLAIALLLFAAPVLAAWPEKPINLIVAYPPGGGTDLVARALQPYLEKYLGGGARIVVVNRSGAGGEVGMAALAAAAPDGYTIGFVNTPPLMTIPIERKAQFTPQSFELLGNIVDDPCNFAVHVDTPVKNLQELAAYARAHPDEVTVGTTGIGSDDHLLMLKFERAANVKMVHVPFKGTAEVRAAIAGKQIMVAAMNVGEALQSIRGGVPLRNLGQFGPARANLAPDLPTGREQGFDFEMSALRGMAAPKGLPADVRERLAKAIERAAADAEFQAQAAKVYAPLRYLSPRDFAAVNQEAEQQLRQLWQELPWSDK